MEDYENVEDMRILKAAANISYHLAKYDDGVGLVIHGRARYCFTRWTPINNGLCIIRLTILYAPIENDADEVKILFYNNCVGHETGTL